MDTRLDARLDAALASLDRLRAELVARYHYCVLDVRLHAEPEGQRVRVRGDVLVDRLRAAALACVRAELAPGWVACDELRAVQTDRWRAVDTVRWLRSGPETAAPQVVEVSPKSGALQILAELQGGACVRAPDGTVGWLCLEGSRECSAPSLSLPTSQDGAGVATAARALWGTPYVLGGSSAAGIDCSGLVQHAVRAGVGVLVPRHSADQRALGALVGPPPPGPGHLVFVWSGAEAPHHVGVCTDATVIHASLSRRRVVEDTKAELWGGAPRVEHVPLHRLLALGRRSAGFSNLLAAGLVLGSDPGVPAEEEEPEANPGLRG